MIATECDGLQNHLMDPELFALFAEEYAAHHNRLLMSQNAELASALAELERTAPAEDKLVQVILDRAPGARTKDKMAALEARKSELEAQLEGSQEPPVLIHPEMGRY